MGDARAMRYEDLKSAWHRALSDSGLPPIGWPTETMDLSSMSRRYWVAVEPHGGQDSEPFHVSATLEFSWDALKTARTRSTEEDILTELFGREDVDGLNTERPWLRVDVKMRASLPYGQALLLPPASAIRDWAREVAARLERIEPLLPEEVVKDSPDGTLEILGWKGAPQLQVTCDAGGALMLEGVELAGWQTVLLPRRWDDPERIDDEPDAQLADMFGRVKRALGAWMESLDNICPATSSST